MVAALECGSALQEQCKGDDPGVGIVTTQRQRVRRTRVHLDVTSLEPVQVRETDERPRPQRSRDMLRVVGNASSTARSTTCVRWAFCTSTSGVWPDTVMFSSSEPTRSSTLIGTLVFPGSSTASRTSVENPASENVSL